MILILSTEYDETTNLVIDWLEAQQKEWVRIHDSDPLEIILNITASGFDIRLYNQKECIDFKYIHSVWYRKGNFKFSWSFHPDLQMDDHARQLYYNLTQEIKTIQDFIHFVLSEKPGINNYLTAQPNKLNVLFAASQIGLQIPYTRVTNRPGALLNEKVDWISKAMWEALFASDQTTGSVQAYTAKMAKEHSIQTDFPSLFQHKIEKKYEVRVFYLDKVCYSMAIFSQQDEQTKTDFRNYNQAKPNRQVPYCLPEKVSEQITQLMNKLNLNSGSIDLIVTPLNHYVFLEVNPVGQFGMVSHPCNYYLEEQIAQKL